MPDLPALETARLLLEPWAPRHGAMLARLAAMPLVMRYIGTGAIWTPAEADEHSSRALVHWRAHGFGWRAAVARDTGWTVGLIALNFAGPGTAGVAEDDYEIGWWLDPDVWGKGLAVEGGRAIRDEAFARLGAPSVVARIQPANAASAAVAAALGLEPEADTTGRHGEPVRVHRLAADAWRRGH